VQCSVVAGRVVGWLVGWAGWVANVDDGRPKGEGGQAAAGQVGQEMQQRRVVEEKGGRGLPVRSCVAVAVGARGL